MGYLLGDKEDIKFIYVTDVIKNTKKFKSKEAKIRKKGEYEIIIRELQNLIRGYCWSIYDIWRTTDSTVRFGNGVYIVPHLPEGSENLYKIPQKKEQINTVDK